MVTSRFRLALPVLALCLSLVVVSLKAAEKDTPRTPGKKATKSPVSEAPMPVMEALEVGPVRPASEFLQAKLLVGSKSYAPQVEDLILDLDTGYFVALVLNSDGKSEKAGRTFVPWGATKIGERNVRLTAEASQLKPATADLQGEDWQQHLTREWLTGLQGQFGIEPEEPNPADRNEAELNTSYLLTTWSSIAKRPANDSQGKSLGFVSDLGIALEGGRIAYAVLANTELPGDMRAIPLSAFIVDSPTEPWILELPEGSIADTSRFVAGKWPKTIDRGWVEYIHVRYGRSPLEGVRTTTKAEKDAPQK